MSNVSDIITVIIQPNSDGNIQYLQYKYKGSQIRVNYHYDANGHLNNLEFPNFMNPSHFDIVKLINQLYPQRLNLVQTVTT